MSHIAIIVGSLRKESYNRRLANAMIRLPAAQGHRFSFAEIGALPLYNQDSDKNPPEAAQEFKQAILAADGLLFVTPEYNRSIPGVLKNAIDHCSRPYGESGWTGKPAGIVGVSPGATGTAMAQQHLRNVLASLDVLTMALPEIFLKWSDDLLTADGEVGERSHAFLDRWMVRFLHHVERHSG
ncbi:NADPH-dependent FMN reductase [Erythrobacter sp. SG61-1L]|uniref:NADPH-dependent FMN reductase n=1 Tax=Erythrobacter sp. SG61-1L TaxID=1603897 RepID=UPI0006C8F6E4|nr:NADPH-dependent FMN reductase [Erythrobacter sp. SG61-1L]KPL68922.1 NADPH-dependent FMN reductase [Erythrobacter sp. SG61-1L]